MFQLSQKCDVHIDGQDNGHSYERRHYVINKSTIRVITKMKTDLSLEALRPVRSRKQHTRGADKSLARPTSPCRRTESIVSLER